MSVTAAGRQIEQAAGARSCLEIIVVFTNHEATLAALRAAGTLAKQLNGRITLVVPQVVSYKLLLDEPPVLHKWNQRRFRVLAHGSPVATTVQFYLCRDSRETLQRVLRPHSLVVVGGSKHWWTAESRLTRRLRRMGHEVVLAGKERVHA